MFRRKRSKSNPPVLVPTNPSANLAATQAFLRDRQQLNGLSSAAAAAALTAFPTRPTQPGEIQTKRMQRRQSISPNGLGSNDVRAGSVPLRRQGSSGSMTERTFRSPSPSPNRGVPPVPPIANVPPVPALPRDSGNFNRNGSKRHSSVEAPPTRLTSPPPTKQGRASSMDRPSQPRSPTSARPPALPRVQELERENSLRSINFSYPRSPSSPSPPASPVQSSGGAGWHTGPVVSGAAKAMIDSSRPKPAQPAITSMETRSIQQSLRKTADAPVHTNKMKSIAGQPGSHLAAGGMTLRNTGSSPSRFTSLRGHTATGGIPSRSSSVQAQPVNPRMVGVESSAPPLERQGDPRSRPQSMLVNDRLGDPRSRPQSVVVADAKKVDRMAGVESKPAPAPAPAPVQQQQRQPQIQAPAPVRPAPATGVASQQSAPGSVSVQSTSAKQPEKASQAAPQTAAAATTPQPRPTEAQPAQRQPLTTPRSSAPAENRLSVNSIKNAHFADAAVIDLRNEKRHNPPHRSFSPAKSALKHSPASSVRGSSPAIAFTNKVPPSDASDSASVYSEDEKPVKKKKSVRVSFDNDSPAVVPSAPILSPVVEQTKRQSVSTAEPYVELMGPRPTLPMFGSIRGSRVREDEEVPEKVTETVARSMESSQSDINPGSSSDHGLGVLASQAVPHPHHARHGAVIDPHAPLPPQVQSVMGSGYSSEDEDEHTPERKVIDKPSPKPDAIDSKLLGAGSGPAISVNPPTPNLSEEPPAAKPVAEPMKQAVQFTPAPYDDDSSEEESVYSDAEEEFDGGFISLDAVLQKPVRPPTPPIARQATPPIPATIEEAPTPRVIEENDDGPSTPTQDTMDWTADTADWDEARRYWAGLSQQQRLALEQEQEATPRATAQDNRVLPNVPDQTVAAISEAAAMNRTTIPDPTPKPATTKNTASLQQPQPAQTPRALQPSPNLRTSMRGKQAENEPAPVHMKSSMRANQQQPRQPESEPDAVHMRRSMRDGSGGAGLAAGGVKSSLRSGSNMPAPISTAPPKEPKGTLQKRHIPSTSSPTRITGSGFTATQLALAQLQASGQTAAPPSVASSALSNDSDSDSSFKKRRRSKANMDSSGRYSMRHSMRGAAPPPARERNATASPSGSKRFSLRSLSPESSPPPPKPGMRGSGSLRGSNLESPKPSKSRFSMAGLSKIRERDASPRSPTSPTRFKSKIAVDSDDDEEVGTSKAAFQSRFADDSSDEEVLAVHSPPATDLTPVRGIPRKPGQEDAESTDLSDEEDPVRAAAPQLPPINTSMDASQSGGAAAATTTNGTALPTTSLTNGNSKQGVNFAAGTLRHSGSGRDLSKSSTPTQSPLASPKEKKRGRLGIFGGVLGKKKTAAPIQKPERDPLGGSTLPTTGTTAASTAATTATSTRAPSPTITTPVKLSPHNSKIPIPPIPSEAAMIASAKGTPTRTPQTPPPRSPSGKLQRRTMPPRFASDSWPMPETPVEEERPRTSDGPGSTSAKKRMSALYGLRRPPLPSREPSAASSVAVKRLNPEHTVGYDSLNDAAPSPNVPSYSPSGAAVVGRSGRPKRFPTLRKAFGLRD